MADERPWPSTSSSRRGRGRDKVLRPVHPNVGIQLEFRRRLLRLVREMDADFQREIKATYRENEPAVAELAADESSAASQLRMAINRMARRWQRRFDDGAKKLAAYFATAVHKRSDAALRKILKDAGFTVEFTMTPAMREIMQATVAEQVWLIKSLPQQYLVGVQGAVMRSVQVGRDLHMLTEDLENQYGVTRRRAELIARDQSNKATSSMVRARQVELGIDQAVWLHSHGGREPRPTHVANSGKKYDPAKGWFDPAVQRYIWPGTEINCRCVSKTVIKGFS